MDYVVDAERVERVLDPILNRYLYKGYPYNITPTMLANLTLPTCLKRGGEAEARWWFFCCMLMRGGVDSDTALRAMSAMYDREMRRGGLWPFKPERAAKLSIEQMTGLLQEAGTGLHRLARDWINAAATLQDLHGGLVMSMLEQMETYEDAVELLHRNEKAGTGFAGFRFKMVSMFLFFVTEAGLIEYFPYPPPIDFHLQRVAIVTGMVQRGDKQPLIAYNQRQHDELQAVLRAAYLDYIRHRGLLSNQVSDAVWLLSRMMCRFNPGNTVYAGERDGRSTPLTPHVVDWFSKEGVDFAKFARSCQRCPVRGHCHWNLGSQPYYVAGQLRILGPRLEPPHEQATLLTVEEVAARPLPKNPQQTKRPELTEKLFE